MTKVLSVIHSGVTDVSKIGSREYIGGVELVKNRKIVPEKKRGYLVMLLFHLWMALVKGTFFSDHKIFPWIN